MSADANANTPDNADNAETTGTAETTETTEKAGTTSATTAAEVIKTPTKPVTANELIRFDNVTKRFGENTVLDNLCFSVQPGKHVTLIGPSGSGKTTILRLLMTLLKPDEG